MNNSQRKFIQDMIDNKDLLRQVINEKAQELKNDPDFNPIIHPISNTDTNRRFYPIASIDISDPSKIIPYQFDPSEVPSGLKFYTKESNKTILNSMIIGSPSDTFHLTESTYRTLNVSYNPGLTNDYVPSDIFFNETIPMTDCIIEIRTDDTDERAMYGRVAITEDYMERIDQLCRNGNNHPNTQPIHIGFIYPDYETNREIISPIIIKYGEDKLPLSTLNLYRNEDTLRNIVSRFTSSETYAEISHFYNQYIASLLSTWYSIQIALMHPTVKDVVSKNRKIKERLTKEEIKQSKSKGRITKYVRHHVIKNPEELNNAIDQTQTVVTKSGTMVRKCMAWYVIGHWRTYKSGKKVFVKPYWKGPMRELQRNLDDGRERIIDSEEMQDTESPVSN